MPPMQHLPRRQIHNRKMLPERLHILRSSRRPVRWLRKTVQFLRTYRPNMQTMQKHSSRGVHNALLLRATNSRKQAERLD